MSWIGRLFGGTPPPPPPANSVVIPDDLAARLTQDGTPLEAAVTNVMRAHFEVVDNPPPTPDGRPFWLEREGAGSDMEDELRDRVTQRRATEEQ